MAKQLIAVSVLLYDRFAETGPDTTSDSSVTESSLAAPDNKYPAPIVKSAPSIAVLPFVNMSSDPEQEYFSDGISEEILNALAGVKELKVAGRTSSFAFKGKDQDLRLIGETLGVEHILEGSVRKSGSTVRITAQLIQVDDGFHLWSDTYDRELTNVFEIQDEISTTILEQLKQHLVGLETADTPELAQRTDPEVFDRYLLAKQRIYERKRLSIESAADLLDQAIAKEHRPSKVKMLLVIRLVLVKPQTAAEVAALVGLSKSRVQHLVEDFNRHGLDAFLDRDQPEFHRKTHSSHRTQNHTSHTFDTTTSICAQPH